MWLPINDSYEISIDGEVKNTKSGRILKQYYSGDYKSIRLGANNKIYIHRLVANTFLPTPTDTKCIVDHIDRNKDNNHASNLRWVSRSVNGMNRTIELKTRLESKNEHHHIRMIPEGDFVVRIVINGKLQYSYCKTIEDAIKKRDLMIENARLPA
jgi:hypothetical protein